MKKRKGKFIVFEGAGGCGKTTQITIIKKYLSQKKVPVLTTREPGGEKSAETIRNLIFLLKDKKLINADHQMALFSAARYFWVRKIIAPNLAKGKFIISDRTFTATGAFQGYAEGGDQKTILGISKEIMGECWPDAVIYFDVSAETSRKRSLKEEDAFDRESFAFVKRIVNGYRKMARENWGKIKWYTIDGEKSIPEVTEDLKKVIDKIIKR